MLNIRLERTADPRYAGAWAQGKGEAPLRCRPNEDRLATENGEAVQHCDAAMLRHLSRLDR